MLNSEHFPALRKSGGQPDSLMAFEKHFLTVCHGEPCALLQQQIGQMRWQVCRADGTNHNLKPGSQASGRMLVTRVTGLMGSQIGSLGSYPRTNSRDPPRGYRQYRH